MVYLLHFQVPLGNAANPRGQARHYLGYAAHLERRLEEHRAGRGAALMAAVAKAGIAWDCVRTWEGGRDVERALKNKKNARLLCPVCSGRAAGKKEQPC